MTPRSPPSSGALFCTAALASRIMLNVPVRVHGDRLREEGQVVRSVLADGAGSRADAGAIDESVNAAERTNGRLDNVLRVGFACDITANVAAADLPRDRLALLAV